MKPLPWRLRVQPGESGWTRRSRAIRSAGYPRRRPGNREADASATGPLRSAEVLEVPAPGRAAPALVLGAGGALAVRAVGGRGHLHEADLADLHPGVDGDRQAGDVGQLEGDMAV